MSARDGIINDLIHYGVNSIILYKLRMQMGSLGKFHLTKGCTDEKRFRKHANTQSDLEFAVQNGSFKIVFVAKPSYCDLTDTQNVAGENVPPKMSFVGNSRNRRYGSKRDEKYSAENGQHFALPILSHQVGIKVDLEKVNFEM